MYPRWVYHISTKISIVVSNSSENYAHETKCTSNRFFIIVGMMKEDVRVNNRGDGVFYFTCSPYFPLKRVNCDNYDR